MAMGIVGEKRKLEEIEEDRGYLSDESDFYGDEATRSDLEEQAASFSVSEYWKSHVPSVTEIALSSLAASESFKSVKLYNYYEGLPSARQLSETVDEFLSRLPPATTPQGIQVPWIRIANPYEQPSNAKETEPGEAPLEDESDWPQFVRKGSEMLDQLTNIRLSIEKENAGKGKMIISRISNKMKDEIIARMLDVAMELHCASGKWMIFCDNTDVNAVWGVVARATANTELGIAAKVAPFGGNAREPHVICVYNRNFRDIPEITRILHKLKDLGIVERSGKAIYYKCDAYTFLGLKSSNEWSIQASLYKSADIFASSSSFKKDKKVDSFFYKKKKDEGNWRSLERE